MSGRAKRWTFTLHFQQPLDESTSGLETLMTQLRSIWEELIPTLQLSYLIVGLERGEETERWHQQGYCEFNKQIRMNQVKRLLRSPSVHLEIAKGSPQQNRTYCLKEGRLIKEHGQISQGQGHRRDLDVVVESIRSGDSIQALWEQHTTTMIRFHQGISLAHAVLTPSEPLMTHPLESYPQNWMNLLTSDSQGSIVVWGASGIGKTTFICSLFPTIFLVSHIDDLLQYPAGSNRPILFDDMDFNHFPRTAQIHLLDQDQPRTIHCRYRTARIPARTLKIFTTNNILGTIFNIDDPAISRRVRIVHLEK